MKTSKITLFIMTLGASFPVFSATYDYDITKGKSWTDSGAWTQGVVPTIADDANIALTYSGTGWYGPNFGYWNLETPCTAKNLNISLQNSTTNGFQVDMKASGGNAVHQKVEIADTISINSSLASLFSFGGSSSATKVGAYLHLKATNFNLNSGRVQIGYWDVSFERAISVDIKNITASKGTVLSFNGIGNFGGDYNSNLGTINNFSDNKLEIKKCEFTARGFNSISGADAWKSRLDFATKTSTITLVSDFTRANYYGDIGDSANSTIIFDVGSNQAFRTWDNQISNIIVRNQGTAHLRHIRTEAIKTNVSLEGGTLSAIGDTSEIGTFNAKSITASAYSTIQVDVAGASGADMIKTAEFYKSQTWIDGEKLFFKFVGITSDDVELNRVFTIMEFTDGDFQASDFASQGAEGEFYVEKLGNGNWEVSFMATAIPECSTIAALLGLLSLGIVVARRRK